MCPVFPLQVKSLFTAGLTWFEEKLVSIIVSESA